RGGFKIFWEPISPSNASTSERSIGLRPTHTRPRSGALRRSSATPGVGAQYSPTRAWGPIIESGMSTNPHADDRSHMTCTEVLERIYDYLDGELTTEVE